MEPDATVSLLGAEAKTKYSYETRVTLNSGAFSLTGWLSYQIAQQPSWICRNDFFSFIELPNLLNGSPISYDLYSEENNGGGGLDYPNSKSDCAIIWREPRQLCCRMCISTEV